MAFFQKFESIEIVSPTYHTLQYIISKTIKLTYYGKLFYTFQVLNIQHQFSISFFKLRLFIYFQLNVKILNMLNNFLFYLNKYFSPNQTDLDQDLPYHFVTLLEMMQQLVAVVVVLVVEIHLFKVQHIVVYIEVFQHQAPNQAAELPVALKHYVSVFLYF